MNDQNSLFFSANPKLFEILPFFISDYILVYKMRTFGNLEK